MTVLKPDMPNSIDSSFAGLVDASRSGWFSQETDEFFRNFPVSATDTVLDVGCGEGAATLFCAQRGAKVLFSDIDAKAVQVLEQKVQEQGATGGYQAFVGDSNPLPVPDQCATRVVCMEVLEHVDDPATVVAELVRAGKPGSLFLISVPGERGERIQQSFAPPVYFQKPHHIRIFSKDSFVSLIEDAGLVVDHYAATGFFWVFWMSIYWAVDAEKCRSGEPVDPERKIEAPFDDSLNQWAALWTRLTSTPEGSALKQEMDKLLPKNQIIVAHKPAEKNE